MNKRYAVIFDMDGVIVDNAKYHQRAWREFIKRYNKSLSEEEIRDHVFGRTNRSTLEYIFGRALTNKEVNQYGEEKEIIYREIYRPDIKPTDGLLVFLELLKSNQIITAIATSADPPNVDFILEALGIRSYFHAIIDTTNVSEGKPHPEIYLKAAMTIDYPPERCIVFEDSVSGIKAGKAANMKVIAITTTHDSNELGQADNIIYDFNEVSLDRLNALVN